MRTRRICLSAKVTLFSLSRGFSDEEGLCDLIQFMTSSVVRPMQCLKLGPEASQPWNVL